MKQAQRKQPVVSVENAPGEVIILPPVQVRRTTPTVTRWLRELTQRLLPPLLGLGVLLLAWQFVHPASTRLSWHPMGWALGASLLALAWGAYFQDPSLSGTAIVLLATIALWLTATTDEKECLAYFGPAYAAYMQRTKRFIPFLL